MLGKERYRCVSKQLKPACIDYRSRKVSDYKYAIAYVLADACKKRNEIFLNDHNWQHFCEEFNLPIEIRPKRDVLIEVSFWDQKLTKLLQQARVIHGHYLTKSGFNIVDESVYLKLLSNRKRKFRKKDDVKYDLAYTKRRAEVSYYFAELTGINELAFEQEEIQLFHATIRLPDKFHKSSALAYDCFDPATAANELHKLLDANFKNKLIRHANKAGVKIYYARVTEPHGDGTPHLHILFWHHDEAYLRKLLEKQYVSIFGEIKNNSILIKHHVDSPLIAIKYLLKTLWGNPLTLNREEAWRKAYGIRCYASSGLNSKLPSKILWDQARNGKLSPVVTTEMIIAAKNKSYANFCRAYTRHIDFVDTQNTFKFKLGKLYSSVKKRVKSFFTYKRQLVNIKRA